MTEYLTLDDAMRAVERLGFTVRDAGLLASAIARPATAFGGAEVYPTMAAKAAALLESVTRNHALFDGNKRTGWTLLVLFLWINGRRLTLDVDDAFDLVVGVAEGRIDLMDSATRLAGHVVTR